MPSVGRVTLRPGGVSLSVPSSACGGGGRRGVIAGWSKGSARRHVRWLQSVDASKLEGLFGLAVTLTVRDCPDSAVEWTRARARWSRLARAAGAELGHWVTEWQMRGVPHLHVCLYFAEKPSPVTALSLVQGWTDIASRWGARVIGQDVHELVDVKGWSKYLSKHSARSVYHAQRSRMPDGWTRSGRLWGHWGVWPVSEDDFVIEGRAWVMLRRALRAWALADARSEKDPRRRAARIRAVKRSINPAWVSGRSSSVVVGLREWAPARVTGRLLADLVAQGATVRDFAAWHLEQERVLNDEHVRQHRRDFRLLLSRRFGQPAPESPPA